jgi:hypothetical protein
MSDIYQVYIARLYVQNYEETMLYIDTAPEEVHGLCFHIKRSMHAGMEHEEKSCENPSASDLFKDADLIGTVRASDMERFRLICNSVEVPHARANQVDPRELWARSAKDVLVADGIIVCT